MATWSKDGLRTIARIFISLFSIVTTSEAETMKNEGMTVKQGKIVMRARRLRSLLWQI